jgi:hypothetical protein
MTRMAVITLSLCHFMDQRELRKGRIAQRPAVDL